MLVFCCVFFALGSDAESVKTSKDEEDSLKEKSVNDPDQDLTNSDGNSSR